jgi:hypothetical protein
MNQVLNLILTHQSATAVHKMICYWKNCVDQDSILIAYGGSRDEFDCIKYEPKFFVQDSGLRTHDHQREFQSYTGMFRAAAKFLQNADQDFSFVHFAEYDHLPLVADLNQCQIERLNREKADVLGFHVRRVDDTSNPHFLYHMANSKFTSYWREITCRDDFAVVLSMFGSGSFWKREAFSAVSAGDEPSPIYMEIYLPTLAHHLGFRVRDLADQNRFVRALISEIDSIDRARKEGAWTLHPVKRLWDE